MNHIKIAESKISHNEVNFQKYFKKDTVRLINMKNSMMSNDINLWNQKVESVTNSSVNNSIDLNQLSTIKMEPKLKLEELKKNSELKLKEMKKNSKVMERVRLFDPKPESSSNNVTPIKITPIKQRP